jgi:hypothetical protein
MAYSVRCKANLDALGIESFHSYVAFEREQEDKRAAGMLPEPIYKSHLSHGPGGRALGNPEIAKSALPKVKPSAHPPDLSELPDDGEEERQREAKEQIERRKPDIRNQPNLDGAKRDEIYKDLYQ